VGHRCLCLYFQSANLPPVQASVAPGSTAIIVTSDVRLAILKGFVVVVDPLATMRPPTICLRHAPRPGLNRTIGLMFVLQPTPDILRAAFPVG
jgi:hypothetical protein